MPFCYCEEANYDNRDELQKFALVLTRFSSLKSFSIEFDNEYGRDEISAVVSGDIIEALSNHPKLECVRINHSSCARWSTQGYAALGKLLSCSKALKKLKLRGNDVNDDLAQVATAALGGNSVKNTLEEIDIHQYDNDITSEGWSAFAKLISENSGTIMDTYNSNHTLKKILTPFSSLRSPNSDAENAEEVKKALGEELYTLLKVNTVCSKFDAARIKIIMHHLNRGFSMEPFNGINLTALPTTLSFMGRMNEGVAFAYSNAEADLGLMYKFLRNVAPVIFDPYSARKETKQEKKNKRKSVSIITYDTVNEEEKLRNLHSKALSLLHEEAEDTFKSIRQRLNNLYLELKQPKVKKARKQTISMHSVSNLPGGFEDKAVTSQFIIHVGKVMNLYKSTKPSKRVHLKRQQQGYGSMISIDLHGMTKDSAQRKLDEQLHQWIGIAMRGEYPWVIPVVIICGKGSQTLSEAVEGWIKENMKVANAPKHLLTDNIR